ncbi:MAG: ABC transporter permease [Bacillota bacterium]|nr:ABC transporter permease [Bacillota bacterium]MDW7677651.1 ABC transporter permease [Bacillota bacterium]
MNPATVSSEQFSEPIAVGNLSKKRLSIEIWKRVMRDKSSVFSFVFLCILIFVALFANFLVDESLVTAQNVAERIQSPSAAHWFGTDLYGRDIFARIVYGSRVSLSIGVFTVIISTTIGGLLGAIAAYFGGKLDDIIMRITDIFLAIPEQLLAMCVVAAMGATPISVISALSVAVIPNRTRLVRSTVLSIVDTQYVEAARAAGMRDFGIILKEILPNTLGPIIVVSTQGIASIMLTASSLSYLGVGIQPPTPEWGAIIFEAREFLRLAPYMCILPGLVIVATALSFNLMGDGLRDALDPRLKD